MGGALDHEWRPRLKTEIAAWRAKDFAVLSDADLAAAMLDLRRFVFEACDIHFYLAVGYGIPLARVAFFCRTSWATTTCNRSGCFRDCRAHRASRRWRLHVLRTASVATWP